MPDPTPLRGTLLHDADGNYRANHVFHSRVQARAANRWPDRATGDLRRFMRLMRGRQLNLPGHIERSINEHRVLISAFVRCDAERAGRAVHVHMVTQLMALRQLHQAERRAARAEASRHAR